MNARRLASRYPGLKPLPRIAKKLCKTTYRREQQKYWLRREEKMVLDAEANPHRWLSRPPRSTCPVGPTGLMGHFGALFASCNTVPAELPDVSGPWDEAT